MSSKGSKWVCILKFMPNQSFLCNFLSTPRCKSQVPAKETKCLSCFGRDFTLNGLLLFPQLRPSILGPSCGAVSIEKDKHVTPTHSSKNTRSSHGAQYCGFQAYSDALKIPPELLLIGIVCFLLLAMPRPQRSLGHC